MIVIVLLIVSGSFCIFLAGFISASKIIFFDAEVAPVAGVKKERVIKNTIQNVSSDHFNKINLQVEQNPEKQISETGADNNKLHDFNSIAKSLAQSNKGNGVVISDQMGFLISSSSCNAEELAAISVLHQQCENVINRNLPFGKLSQIIFVSDNDLYLTVFPFIIDGFKVYISSLSNDTTNYQFLLKEAIREATIKAL